MSEVSKQGMLAADSTAVASGRPLERSARHPTQHAHVYLNTPGAAERLDVSPRTLIDYRSRGGGPKWVRLGRAVRYRSDWLDQWADERAVTSTSQETARARG
jgi:predicted DNA-binding transcriptional regulator AlpA